jgi:hypothetical protein
MKRTFNYTGRHHLTREHASVRVYRKEDGIRWFDADLRLNTLPLPPTAHVFVEAYFERAYRRFDYGVVGSIRPPDDRSLGDIDYGQRIQFRIKVVDERGKLLANADGVRPSAPEQAGAGREPLLPVDPRDDMGQEVWRLRINTDGPSLEVNGGIEDVMALFRNNPTVTSLIYPQVLRNILAMLLMKDPIPEYEDGWEKRWLDFGALCSGAPHPDLGPNADVQEVEAWIDSVVSAFSTRLRSRDLIQSALREEKL